ncbi:MAG: carbon-nitrogen hydrolase family protein, partial [Rhodospirillaceae bacterium]|nr:carbon-nitrogen hydrolase family protein [Rhodospirillaceae bacterium]
DATHRAAEAGATWIITPETALQGYFFADGNTNPAVATLPTDDLTPLIDLVRRHALTLFLGCADRDATTQLPHNSCVVFGPDGSVKGRHRKLIAHGGAEAWSKAGTTRDPIVCDDIAVGVMVCADIWFPENPAALRSAGAEVLTLSAAWPPGPMGPNGKWEEASAATGLPVFVCNQTGRHRMDMTHAESAVIEDGQRRMTYSGETPAALLFDWAPGSGVADAPDFHRIPL